MNTKRRFLVLMLAVLMLAVSVTGCSSCGKKGKGIDNESTRLVLSTQELDGVFNPFYSSSATDSTIIGMTQIGMLSSDKDGKVAFGENEAWFWIMKLLPKPMQTALPPKPYTALCSKTTSNSATAVL